MANVNIEKISNGFILILDGVKTYCEGPEVVCGQLAEWALRMCDRLDDDPGVDFAKYMSAQADAAAIAKAQAAGLAQAQRGQLPPWMNSNQAY